MGRLRDTIQKHGQDARETFYPPSFPPRIAGGIFENARGTICIMGILPMTSPIACWVTGSPNPTYKLPPLLFPPHSRGDI